MGGLLRYCCVSCSGLQSANKWQADNTLDHLFFLREKKRPRTRAIGTHTHWSLDNAFP